MVFEERQTYANRQIKHGVYLNETYYQVHKVIDLHPRSDLFGHDEQTDLGLDILPDPGKTGD